MSKRIVIVGAGPGGLAAAMLLANAGADVTLLERRGQVGGRTSTIETDGGFKFDLGPTFFLYPRILEELFAMCGRDLHAEVEMVRLDPQYHLVFENESGAVDAEPAGDIRATPDIERMQAEIAKLSPGDAERFPKFIAENRRKFDAFTPILQQPWAKLTDYLNPGLMSMLPLVRPWASVDKDLGRYFKDERIRLAFSFQSKYLGMSPFRCPSLFTILSYLEYDYGVFHPTGGCAAVSEAMARVCREMGVTVELNAEVTGLGFDGRRCTSVTVGRGGDAGTLEADAVVVNADFARAMASLVPDRVRRKWTDAKLEKKKYSCSTFMMYLGVDVPPEEIEGVGGQPLEHHTIFLAHDYAKNLDEIENRHQLSENPSVYVQHAARTDGTMAPEGKSSLYVLAPVTHEHGNVDWAKETPAFRERVLRQMGKLAPGLRGIEGRIEYEQVITPDGWRDDLNIHKGATFNLAHNLGQMLHRRPNNRFEDLDGVYLVGGGTHPGSGLPVIYEGARITAALVGEDLGLELGWGAREPATATPGVG